MNLIVSEYIYPTKILKLNFRERKKNSWEDSGSDEISVLFPGMVLSHPLMALTFRFVWNPQLYLYETNGEFGAQLWPGLKFKFNDNNWFLGCLQGILKKTFEDVKSTLWKYKFEEQDAGDEETFWRIPFQIWNVSKFATEN
jgi:hypothetical protein